VELVCASCSAVNRVPDDRLGEDPVCGRCGAALLAGEPRELDETAFERVLERHGMPLIVDFWAPWCGPCRMMAPQFEAAARQMAGRVSFAKVNTDLEPDVATRLGIRGIPTLALFAGGREIARTSGAMPAADLVRWIERALPPG
jgi:thioredoxin 2